MSAPRIPVYRPWKSGTELEYLSKVIERRWYTQGPEVLAFESEFSKWVGTPFSCAVSSATAGLELSLRVLGVGEGDEVILPSHSFIATANSVKAVGAIPCFIDIELSTFNLDPSLLEGAITDRTKAVIAVHQLGMPCDLAKILPICKKHGISVIEDAACAMGSEIEFAGHWEKIGKPHGDVCVFSFHPRKLLTTGEGGMITSRDQALDQRLRRLRHHGMSLSDLERHSSTEIIEEKYLEPGWNARMSDLEAALGRSLLPHFTESLMKRKEQAASYKKNLENLKGLSLSKEPSYARTNWQSYCVLFEDDARAKRFRTQALSKGIATRAGVMNAHEEPAYPKDSYRLASSTLKNSEKARRCGVILPLYFDLTSEEQLEICELIRDTLK